MAAATEKLARLEDAEEMEDVTAYCLQLNRVADLKKETEPELHSLITRAADKIIHMSNFRDSAAAQLSEKIERATKQRQAMKTEIFSFLDEIDGQITDDPVSLIREKLEEIL